MADVFPVAFLDWHCEVVVLDVKRSFWEKATILYTEYHRPTEKPTPDRFSRHYADKAALSRHPTGAVAIDQASSLAVNGPSMTGYKSIQILKVTDFLKIIE
jgi:hypothetical protein